MKQKMVKRPCSYGGKCKTLTEVDTSLDLESLGMFQTKWCEYHERLYKAHSKILTKLVPKFNKKKIQNKFGKVIKFSHHSDVSNYLYQHNKGALRKTQKQAEKRVKK